jgi:hypothetical protein
MGANMAFADQGPTNDHDDHRRDRDDVRFQCEFKGFYQKKDQLTCTAFGQFDRRDEDDHRGDRIGDDRRNDRRRDRDDFLTVVCGQNIVYQGSVFAEIFGDRHHDGNGPAASNDHDRDRHRDIDVKLWSTVPFAAALDIKNVNFRDFGPFPATLAVSLNGTNGYNNGAVAPANLVGSCRFHRDSHRPWAN